MGKICIGVVLAGALAAAPAAEAATPSFVHAHRGGSYVHGVPAYGENSLPAFAAAAAGGFVLELDVKLTSDRVPVVIHDVTLDRTTNCAGQVAAITAARLRAQCRSDVIGSPGSGLGSAVDPTPEPVPTLAEVLSLARGAGARLNLEIKNSPVDADFDPTPLYALTVMQAVKASGFPAARLIVQAFWPPSLDIAKVVMPRAQRSLLTLAALNVGAPAFAAIQGDEWVSPAWPFGNVLVPLAHALGRLVVPYTLNTPAAVRAARARGVDAVITDDPSMALAALG